MGNATSRKHYIEMADTMEKILKDSEYSIVVEKDLYVVYYLQAINCTITNAEFGIKIDGIFKSLYKLINVQGIRQDLSGNKVFFERINTYEFNSIKEKVYLFVEILEPNNGISHSIDLNAEYLIHNGNKIPNLGERVKIHKYLPEDLQDSQNLQETTPESI